MEIVKLHGIPKDIVSKSGRRFQTYVWEALEKVFRIKLNFNSSYQPQKTDAYTERKNQILEDILRVRVLDFKGNGKIICLWAIFICNNSYQSTIKMAPFEALYGRNTEHPCVRVSRMKP